MPATTARLEGAELAQDFAVRLVRVALTRGQFYLCAEILRFLIPPHDGGAVAWGPAAPASTAAGTAAAGGQQQQQAAGDAGSTQDSGSSWFGWLWGGGGAPQAAAAQPAGAEQQPLLRQRSAAAAAVPTTLPHGTEGCRLVAERAWKLLEQGRLGQLVQVIHSMSFLTGGLAGIMAAHQPPDQPQQQQQQVTVDDLVTCVVAAVEELPVWESSDVEQVRAM